MNLATRAVTIALLAAVCTACGLSATRETTAVSLRAQLAPTPPPPHTGAVHGLAAVPPATPVSDAEAQPSPTVPPATPARATEAQPSPTVPPATPARATEAQPSPTAPPTVAAVRNTPDRIVIGSIQLDRPLVAVGLDPANDPVVPDHDVAWYDRSASPGEGENVVVWAHALRFAAAPDLPAPFERVREARVGDSITVVTADGQAHAYVIAEQIWATPDQVRWILPTGDERLTLVNCIGDYVIDANGTVVSMTHRLITIARPLN